MPTIMIGYDSKLGHTKKMAEEIAKGVESVDGVEVIIKHVDTIAPTELLEVEGLLVGSPTYFGLMSAKVKDFFDQSISVFKKLDGKVGGAFTSSGGIACGAETTIQSILAALLIHGMIIQGDSGPNHYGVAAQNEPSDEALETCRRKGERTAQLVLKLFPKES